MFELLFLLLGAGGKKYVYRRWKVCVAPPIKLSREEAGRRKLGARTREGRQWRWSYVRRPQAACLPPTNQPTAATIIPVVDRPTDRPGYIAQPELAFRSIGRRRRRGLPLDTTFNADRPTDRPTPLGSRFVSSRSRAEQGRIEGGGDGVASSSGARRGEARAKKYEEEGTRDLVAGRDGMGYELEFKPRASTR